MPKKSKEPTYDNPGPGKISVLLAVPLVIFLDEAKLPIYAQKIADRWENNPEEFDMEDLVTQAGLDGDVELPEEWEVDDLQWEDALTVDDLADIAESEE